MTLSKFDMINFFENLEINYVLNFWDGFFPFEWIEYVRDYDSEDNKPIVVCKFKGVKWYKKFKSPFQEINYIFENPSYKEGSDPKFMKFTTIDSDGK